MTTPQRLNEATFGWGAPFGLVFTPLAAGPRRDQPTDPQKPRSSYASDQDWRNHLEHELEAARHRGDGEAQAFVLAELAALDTAG